MAHYRAAAYLQQGCVSGRLVHVRTSTAQLMRATGANPWSPTCVSRGHQHSQPHLRERQVPALAAYLRLQGKTKKVQLPLDKAPLGQFLIAPFFLITSTEYRTTRKYTRGYLIKSQHL